MTHGTHLLQQRKSCRCKMPYIISSRSVADGISLLVKASKLVCRILISVDKKSQMNLPINKTTIRNSLYPSYTSYSTYVACSAYLRKKAQSESGNQPFCP